VTQSLPVFNAVDQRHTDGAVGCCSHLLRLHPRPSFGKLKLILTGLLAGTERFQFSIQLCQSSLYQAFIGKGV
jgi:hypothetical protein